MQTRLILGIILYLAITSLVVAQTATGVLRGIVQDLTGAVLVDVHVVLVSQLAGMRERAKLAGGKLAIWTELDSGTEIEFIIPGPIAYVKSTRPFWYFAKRSAAETDDKETIGRE